jgi:hypothetical protein
VFELQWWGDIQLKDIVLHMYVKDTTIVDAFCDVQAWSTSSFHFLPAQLTVKLSSSSVSKLHEGSHGELELMPKLKPSMFNGA